MSHLSKPNTGTLHLLDLDGKFAKIEAMGQNRLCNEIRSVNKVNPLTGTSDKSLVSSNKSSTAALRGRLKAFYWCEARIERIVGLEADSGRGVKHNIDETTIITLPMDGVTNVNDMKNRKGFNVETFNGCFKGRPGRAMVYTFMIEYHNDVVLLKEADSDSTDIGQEDDEQSNKNYTLATYEDKTFVVQPNGRVQGSIMAAPKAVVAKCLTELLETAPGTQSKGEDTEVASKSGQQQETSSNNDDKVESKESDSDSPVRQRKTRQQLKAAAAASNDDDRNDPSNAGSPVTQRKTRQQLKAEAAAASSVADSPVAPRKTGQQLKAARIFNDKQPPKHRLMVNSPVAQKTRHQPSRTKRTVDDENGPAEDPTPPSKSRPQKRARVREESSSRASSASKKLHPEDPRDVVLVVFQASPLVHTVDGNDSSLEFLDFEDEEDALREALDGTGVRLKFEAATDKNFGSCFLNEERKMFHFSGHGQDSCLFIENKYGGTHQLKVDESLKDWIQSSENKIMLAFLAASSSRSAGEIFIDAGVPFVVCVEKDKLLPNEIATVFARIFYRVLANGHTVQQAYESAKLGVVHSSDVIQTRLNSHEEAEKFLLLTNEDYRNTALFRKPKPGKSTNMDHPSRPRALLPFPPSYFVGREVEMYSVLKSMLLFGERFVTVTGERGMGKRSFSKAIGHYMDKRKMWGDLYWIPSPRPEVGDDVAGMLFQILQMMAKHSTTNSFQDAVEYKTVCGRIYDSLYLQKAIIVVDATKIQAESIKLLSVFLHDLLENTKRVKLLVCHREDTPLDPPTMAGFSSSRTTITLGKLDFKSMFQLFGRHCRYTSPVTWNDDFINQRYSQNEETVAKVLGEGIPAHTIFLAKNIDQSEYNQLVDPSVGVAIQESDFSRVLRMLPKYRVEEGDSNASEQAPPAVKSPQQVQAHLRKDNIEKGDKATTNQASPPVMSPQQVQAHLPKDEADNGDKAASKQTSPPVKSQQEVQAHFLPVLRKDKVYRKISSVYARPAQKGESLTVIDWNEIDGTTESQITIADDTSMVVCGNQRGQQFVLSDEKFRAGYAVESAKPIPESVDDEQLQALRKKGMSEYQSKKDVHGHVVTEEDVNFFRHEANPSDSEAFFITAWGEKMRVEKGDYLAMDSWGEHKGFVFRIDKNDFKKHYVEQTHKAGDEQKDMEIDEPTES